MGIGSREVFNLAHHFVTNLLVKIDSLKVIGVQINLRTATLKCLALDGVHDLGTDILATPLLLKPQKLNGERISPLKTIHATDEPILLIVSQYSDFAIERNACQFDIEVINTVF